jgi:dipeptidyl-peptidase-4
MRSALVAICLAVLAFQPVPAQQSRATTSHAPLTIDDLYSYDGFSRFNGKAIAAMNWVPEGGPWIDDSHFLWPDGNADTGGWQRVDATSGSSQPLLNASTIEPSLLRMRPIVFSLDRKALVLTNGTSLYHYNTVNAAVTRVTTSLQTKTEITLSPSGRLVAFIKENNLYVSDVAAPAEHALTTDGGSKVFNGVLDWVYSEELYGRGTYRAYWWSPDSSKIALLQLDDRAVPEYTLVDEIPYHPTLDTFPYPKAGDPNPRARIFIVDVSDALRRAARGEPAQRMAIDTDNYKTVDYLISNVGWTPDSRSIVYQLQNREQTWLDLNRADTNTGTTTTLFRETSPAWVQRWDDESANPVWLKDKSFLWLSERNGWRHLYHYRADGTLIGQVTTGEWEVRATHDADISGRIYFSSTQSRSIDLDVYRISVDGTGATRLSAAPGTHTPFFNPSHTMYLDKWEDASNPPQVRLHSTDRTGDQGVVRIVEANPATAASDYGLSKPEFVQVKTRDGFVMEAMMIKPPDFDPSRRYPVYQATYGGPHSPQVLNAWPSIWNDYAYHQLLAQRGAIVWICDNRTSSGKGVVSAWPLYKNLGALELRDIEDGLAWLKQQPYVDASRIGISGVSYGGFMTLYALTHSNSFAMGIAEGAVSDWRDYDSIYTERYLGLPSENPEGYRRSSPRYSAANLSGELLIIHGGLDDNVHLQNASQFVYELQKAGKQFQMMLYPRSAHGVNSGDVGPHVKRLMLDFTTRNLRLGQ